MPNLPTEDELRSHLVARHMDLAKGLYFEGTCEEWELEEAEKLADETMQLIHHYATKRELEAKINAVKELLEYRSYTIGEGEPRIVMPRGEVRRFVDEFDIKAHVNSWEAELKAQKEQESKDE